MTVLSSISRALHYAGARRSSSDDAASQDAELLLGGRRDAGSTLTISKATTGTTAGVRLFDADVYKVTGTAV
jgi:hypothetical protein